MSRKLWQWIFWILFLGSLTFGIYSPSLNHEFVSYDDPTLVFENPIVRDFDLRGAFASVVADDYLPLVFTSFSLEHRFFGFDPFYYHLDNLILHTLNTLLVLVLMYLLSGGNFWISGFVALFFSLHPLHVESVAWVSERKDVLFCFFYLLALLAAVVSQKSEGKRRIYWSLAVFGSFLLSSLSKLMAVSLPAVLVLLDLHFKKDWRKSILWRIPYFVTSALFVGIHFHLHKPSERERGALSLMNGIDSLAFYFSKTFFPLGLSVFYQKSVVTVSAGEYAFLAFVLLVFAAFLKFSSQQKSLVVLGLGFFLFTILPVLQIIPFGHRFFFADRLVYLPSIGLLLALVSLAWALLENRPRFSMRIAACALAGILVLTCGILTFERLPVWRNSLALWSDAAMKYPASSVAHNNLGSEWVQAGDLQKAQREFKSAIELEENYVEPRVGLGLVYSDLGQLDLAEKELRKAIELQPQFAKIYFNLGVVAEKKGDLISAAEAYEKNISLSPDSAAGYVNLGSVYYKSNQKSKAFEAFQKAIDKDPYLAEAHNNLGFLWLEQEKLEQALVSFRQAIHLDPQYEMPHRGLANVYIKTGQLNLAAEELKKAQALQLQSQGRSHRRRF